MASIVANFRANSGSCPLVGYGCSSSDPPIDGVANWTFGPMVLSPFCLREGIDLNGVWERNEYTKVESDANDSTLS